MTINLIKQSCTRKQNQNYLKSWRTRKARRQNRHPLTKITLRVMQNEIVKSVSNQVNNEMLDRSILQQRGSKCFNIRRN